MIFFAASFSGSDETGAGAFEETGKDDAGRADANDAAELTGELGLGEETTIFDFTAVPDFWEPKYETETEMMPTAQSKKVKTSCSLRLFFRP